LFLHPLLYNLISKFKQVNLNSLAEYPCFHIKIQSFLCLSAYVSVFLGLIFAKWFYFSSKL
jgi:hypothetical protein